MLKTDGPAFRDSTADLFRGYCSMDGMEDSHWSDSIAIALDTVVDSTYRILKLLPRQCTSYKANNYKEVRRTIGPFYALWPLNNPMNLVVLLYYCNIQRPSPYQESCLDSLFLSVEPPDK
ncbi:MAG: hypothetical protein GF331_10705 [Chitinivibrionales bacterium]|nr:hypothetical protein [Chitinivibrionales bacterium]